MSHLGALLTTPFDLRVFARVATQRLGRTVGYLLLLTTLASAATTVAVTRDVRQLVRRLEPELDKLPTVEIRRGQASANVPQPWLYRFGNDDHGRQIVLIIDTTGRRQDFASDEIGLFLQRYDLVVKPSDGRRQTISLSLVPNCTIGPAAVRRFIAHWMRRLPFYLALASFAWYLLAKTTQALLLVLAALAGSTRRPLGFGSLFTVGVYALGPVVLLAAARPFVPFAVPGFCLGYCALAVVYAVLGGRRAATPPSVDAQP